MSAGNIQFVYFCSDPTADQSEHSSKTTQKNWITFEYLKMRRLSPSITSSIASSSDPLRLHHSPHKASVVPEHIQPSPMEVSSFYHIQSHGKPFHGLNHVDKTKKKCFHQAGSDTINAATGRCSHKQQGLVLRPGGGWKRG